MINNRNCSRDFVKPEHPSKSDLRLCHFVLTFSLDATLVMASHLANIFGTGMYQVFNARLHRLTYSDRTGPRELLILLQSACFAVSHRPCAQELTTMTPRLVHAAMVIGAPESTSSRLSRRPSSFRTCITTQRMTQAAK